MTQKERAAALGISTRQLRKDEAAGCPEDLPGAIKWRSENRNRGSASSGSLNDETTRLRAAQAEQVEIEVAQLRGELMLREDVQTVVGGAMLIINAEFRGAPRRMAPELIGASSLAEMQQRLRNEFTRIRAAISEKLAELALEPDEPGDETAAAEDAGRVGGSVPDSAGG